MFEKYLPMLTLVLFATPACHLKSGDSEGTAFNSPITLWTCLPDDNSGYAVADIIRKGGSIFARVTQVVEHRNAVEWVPVAETRSQNSFEYGQSGQATLENGLDGQTSNFRMEINVVKTESVRLDAAGFLALRVGPTGDVADQNNTLACKNYDAKKVEKRISLKIFKDRKVNMGEKTVAVIEVPFDQDLPQVDWNTGVGFCDDVQVWAVSRQGSKALIRVEPELGFEDGINSCLIEISQPSGKKATVELFHEI